MVIELVEKKDCAERQVGGGKGGERKGGEIRTRLKKIDNRDRKKCHKCGRDNGSWHEQFLRGRLEYVFLCSDCMR